MLQQFTPNLTVENDSSRTSSPTTPYGLDRCQIDTPDQIVRGFWEIVRSHRRELGDVIDLGAGDGRFATGADYDLYHGYEIDSQRLPRHPLPKSAQVINQCAFEAPRNDYDVCVGNPPYVRHHDIEEDWRENLVKRIDQDLGIQTNRLCNLFVYFICLGLLKTKSDGLVALLIPYEWVSRPSAKPLRALIKLKKWDVHVYRFRDEVFKGVLTTASISIIDKSACSGSWKFYDIDSNFRVVEKQQASGSTRTVLKYGRRATLWALRGLSPGSQKVFTLTERERIAAGLWKSDVVRCVTSLRTLPRKIKTLTEATFEKHFVKKGRKCWLIKSTKKPSERLAPYLNQSPKAVRQNATCKGRNPWHTYREHPAGKILYASGFTSHGPKFVINAIEAKAVGSVCSIHSERPIDATALREKLVHINFEERIVAHAKTLKKVEVGQMNSALKAILSKRIRKET